MLRVGIIGCGNIAETYLENARLFRDFSIMAVADLRTEAAAGLASRFNLRALKVDDMMRSDEIDLVLNLTVPAAHAEISLNAIEAGKHVFLKSRWRRRSMAPSGSTGPPATGMSGLALPRTRFSDPPPRMPAA